MQITRKDDDNFLDRKSLLKAGLEIRQKPSKNTSSEAKIDSDAYARQLVDQILSAKVSEFTFLHSDLLLLL